MGIEKVSVLGGGTMGRQIALNCAINGIDVILYDTVPDVLDAVRKWSEIYLAGRIAKGKLTEEQVKATKERFHITGELNQATADPDLVIEAVIEDMAVKQAVFAQLDQMCPPKTILATNSSTYASSVVAEKTGRMDRALNAHYFNPALQMKLIEIVVNPKTSQETIDLVTEFAKATKKVPIIVKRELPGFIVNNLLGGLTAVAWDLFLGGYASYQDIDTAATQGLGHPVGPFQLMDMNGLDTILAVKKARHESDPEKNAPPPQILVDMVARGELGVKSGKGFYDYSKHD